MPDAGMVRTVLEQVGMKVTRSTVLQPLHWFAVIFVLGAVESARVGAPPLLTAYFAFLSGGVLVLAGYAYIYFMHRNPDLLHTERFLLSRMSLENERLVYGHGRTALEIVNELQEITELPDGKTILLDHEPIPASVRLFINGVACLSKSGEVVNYRINGREVFIENSSLREAVATAVAEGDAKVEYRHHIAGMIPFTTKFPSLRGEIASTAHEP